MKFKTLQTLMSLLIGIIFLSGISNAEQKSIVKEYSYEAGEQDSKISSRTMAMTQIKRLVLEEAGTYITGTTEVKNLQLESDQINAMMAGIVSLKIIHESWDGRVFYMKAEATIDTDDIAKKLETISQNQDQIGELESTQQRIDELEAEVESLKAEMLAMQNQGQQSEQTADNSLQTAPKQAVQPDYVTRYNDAVDQMRSLDMVQNSYVDINSGDSRKAIDTLNNAIVLSPQAAPTAYIARSIAFVDLNAPQKAMAALNKAVQLSPAIETRAALARAFVYERSGNNKQALEEVNRAIRMDPREPWAYRQRAGLYVKRGSGELALADMRKAGKLHDIRRLRQEFIKAAPATQQHSPIVTITSPPVYRIEGKPDPGMKSREEVRLEQEKNEKNKLDRNKVEKDRIVRAQQHPDKRQQGKQLRMEATRQQQQKRQQDKKQERQGLKQTGKERQRQKTDNKQKNAAKGPKKEAEKK